MKNCLLFEREGDKMSSEVNTMLLQFRVKNYRSIGDELTIDLTAGKGREHPGFLIIENGVKILPVISLYGSNASGKTNIIQAIRDFFYDVLTSYKHSVEHGDFMNVIPFLYDESLRAEPTEIEAFFVLGKYQYQYGYKTKQKKIQEEWLYRRTLSTRDTVVRPIFERV